MLNQYSYSPGLFFLITVGFAALVGPLILLLQRSKVAGLQNLLILVSLCLPCALALSMLFGSGDEVLITDFCVRLTSFGVSPGILAFILLVVPGIVFLSTALSLLFGYSSDQFTIKEEFSEMKGPTLFSLAIPLILAPIIEELGWRGYGVDSLLAYFNPLIASILFGLFWAVWHLPTFFIDGFYQNRIWHENKIYVLNFFLSMIVVSFLMNWAYLKTGRSIPPLMLFHAMLNFSMMILRTQEVTKCISTFLFTGLSALIIWLDWNFLMSPVW